MKTHTHPPNAVGLNAWIYTSNPPYAFMYRNSCTCDSCVLLLERSYRGADRSLARPGRKQARKDARRRTRFQQNRVASCHQVILKAPNEIHSILTETLACFLSGRAKDLSAPQ